MAIAKITLIGMTDYMEGMSDDLFKYLALPAGVDRETLIGSIIMKGGDVPPLGEDACYRVRSPV